MIVSQGRVADRVSALLDGARMTGAVLAERFDLPLTTVGVPALPKEDSWPDSLAAADDHLNAIAKEIRADIESGASPVILVSNTCPVSIASLPVAAQCVPGLKVLWIDAHGDFNTPATTASGYLGGMCLSATCGLWDSGHGAGVEPPNVCVVGVRDVDTLEHNLLREAGVTLMGPQQASPEAIANFIGVDPVWIHIDWDVLEPGIIPAEYSIPHGMRPEAISNILATIPSEQVRGIELAEFTPVMDSAVNAEACELIAETVAPVLELLAVPSAGGR